MNFVGKLVGVLPINLNLGHPAILGFSLGILLFSGCAGDKTPIELSLAPVSSQSHLASSSSEESCSFIIDPVTDDRLRQYDVGSMGGRPINASNVHSWLSQRFAFLHTQSDETTPSVSQEEPYGLPALRLTTSLKKLYLHTLPSTINANVLLTVDFSMDGQTLLNKSYRGRVSNTFWYGGADVYNEAYAFPFD